MNSSIIIALTVHEILDGQLKRHFIVKNTDYHLTCALFRSGLGVAGEVRRPACSLNTRTERSIALCVCVCVCVCVCMCVCVCVCVALVRGDDVIPETNSLSDLYEDDDTPLPRLSERLL